MLPLGRSTQANSPAAALLFGKVQKAHSLIRSGCPAQGCLANTLVCDSHLYPPSSAQV